MRELCATLYQSNFLAVRVLGHQKSVACALQFAGALTCDAEGWGVQQQQLHCHPRLAQCRLSSGVLTAYPACVHAEPFQHASCPAPVEEFDALLETYRLLLFPTSWAEEWRGQTLL